MILLYLLGTPPWFSLQRLYVKSANLGESYFSNRQDRYLVLENSPDLANYYEHVYKICRRIAKPTLEPLPFSKLSVFETQNNEYRAANTNESVSIECLTSNLISNSERVSRKIADVKLDDPCAITFMTPYLNVDDHLFHELRKQSDVTIISAGLSSNGFKSGNFLYRLIPKVYEQLKFILSESLNGIHKFSLLEYNRENWTFHGKGITIRCPKNTLFIFGSSNYGLRSSSLDVENHAFLSSSDDNFKKILKSNESSIIRYSTPARHSERPNFVFKNALYRMLKRFF